MNISVAVTVFLSLLCGNFVLYAFLYRILCFQNIICNNFVPNVTGPANPPEMENKAEGKLQNSPPWPHPRKYGTREWNPEGARGSNAKGKHF